MEKATLSINQIDFDLFRQQLEHLDVSLKANNCCQVIRDASAAIDQVFQSQLLVLFDIRAHAHAKQGHYDSACADAEQMIKHAPEIGAGYARKGDVHSMFGRQTRAIEVYSTGLEKAASDHSQVDRITAGKTTATLKSETCVDYLEKLPIELANNIILQLSQNDKSTCLSVSRIWRKRTMNYSAAWTDLVINGDGKDLQLVNVLPDIGRHIEKLEVNTNNDQLRSGCLHRMITQHFPEIRSLKMTALGTRELAPYLTRLSVAFFQIQKTLTTLDVNLGDNQNGVTLADVLRFCRGLTALSYSTASPMTTSTGDYSTMEQHDTLINLSLTSSLITGEDIKPMLQRCQRLRRLVMDKCFPTVFDPINKYAPNLEILSYNNLDVPDLSSSTAGQPPGLRNIYTNNGGVSVPTKDIFPLLYKNMTTLKTAYLNTSALSQQEVQQLNTAYPDFKLWNLESLTFWTKNQTESLIIQALRGVTTLSFLSLLNVNNLNAIVTVIKSMPPVKELRIEHTDYTTSNLGLVELFKNYSTFDQKPRALSIAYFRKSTAITDAVLNSLADVTTLRSITLKNLDYISTEGIKNFLEKTTGQLTYLKLCDMEAVTSECIMMISCVKPSTEVHLENLPRIRNQGIRAMVNNKSAQFKRLTIKNCKSITKDCVRYAKKNVKTVAYE